MSLLIGLSFFSGCSSSDSDSPSTGGQTSTSGGAGASTGGTSTTTTGGTSTSTGGTSTTTTGGVASPNGGSGGATGGTANGGTTTGGTVAGGAPAGGGGGVVGGGGSGGIAPGGAAGAGGDSGGAGGSGGSPEGTHWVGTWAASPYLAASDAQPPTSLSNAVLRQVTRVSIGGSQIRVQFSNLAGNGPVTLKSAHVAVGGGMGRVADSTIDAATDKALAFSGMESVTIAQGKEVWSDPLDFALAPLSKLTITTALGSVPSNLTAHAGSRTTSYIQANSTDVSQASMASAQKTDHWYFISGIDVMAPESSKAVAIIGDSITDGRGTDTNGNNRWTDFLADRLQANAATANIGVLNQGIGATNLIGGGTAAEARFERDVLNQSGVKYAIIYDGVNDIGNGASFQAMKTVYDKLIAAGRAKNLLVFGATIPPFGGHSYYSAAHEMVRTQVNTYVKSGAFDGVIDFDAALTDGGNPPKLKSEYAAWAQMDGLHPGPAGYEKMGGSVDLSLFK